MTQLFDVEDQADAHPFAMIIDDTGNLVTPEGYPLQKLGEKYGFQLEYQKLRGELLSVLFDLVTPVYEVQEIVEQEERALASKGPIEPNNEEHIGKLRRLVLARTRTLQVLGDDIAEMIETERLKAQDDTQRRAPVRHPVVGYVKPLPPHYRASAKARELCLEEEGIVLAEYGETYVREHTRGKSTEKYPKGHKATLRVGRAATRHAETRAADPDGPIKPRSRKPKKRGKK